MDAADDKAEAPLTPPASVRRKWAKSIFKTARLGIKRSPRVDDEVVVLLLTFPFFFPLGTGHRGAPPTCPFVLFLEADRRGVDGSLLLRDGVFALLFFPGASPLALRLAFTRVRSFSPPALFLMAFRCQRVNFELRIGALKFRSSSSSVAVLPCPAVLYAMLQSFSRVLVFSNFDEFLLFILSNTYQNDRR